jgi:hypothetical protein
MGQLAMVVGVVVTATLEGEGVCRAVQTFKDWACTRLRKRLKVCDLYRTCPVLSKFEPHLHTAVWDLWVGDRSNV